MNLDNFFGKVNSYTPLDKIQDLDSPLGFFAWIQGVLFIMFIYHFFIYSQNRNKTFLFYSLYILSLTLYFLFECPPIFLDSIRIPFIPVIYHQIHLLAYVFYVSFVRELAKTKTTFPKWDNVLEWLVWSLLFNIVLIGILGFFVSPRSLALVLLITLFILTISSLVNAVIIYRIKERYINFFIIGAICYAIGANLALYTSFVTDRLLIVDGSVLSPSVYIQVGTIIEILFFALSLGSRMTAIEKEKNASQLSLLQKTLEASEMKMIALKAQMNPHFIFNVLNSVNNYILKNDTETASDYLTKCSKLIRRVLKSSSKSTISLQEELNTVETYIKLEQLRIEGGFKYQLTIDHEIDPGTIMVPPLFLQPYIENAIWHGLSNKTGDKKISIILSSMQKFLSIEIIDNGVGRELASQLNIKNSMGTHLTQTRIKSFYGDQEASVIITDLKNKGLTPAGTKVAITLPI